MLLFLKSDDNCRAVIITGAGNKSFIAGADIKLMSQMSPDDAYKYSLLGHKLCNIISNFSKPVIAAVNGYALGGGCEISLSCHMRFSSPNAIFAQPEVSLGILAGWGGTQRLSKIIGYSNAFDLLLTGRKINADEAYRIGLVNKIFDTNLIRGIINLTSPIVENSSNDKEISFSEEAISSPETELTSDLKEFGVDTDEPDLFNVEDNQISASENLLGSTYEDTNEDNEEDDLEIPAFLRRQKN